jgi:hypothetical protein
MRVAHVDIFVADRFIGWQERVLGALQGAYQKATKVRPVLVQT